MSVVRATLNMKVKHGCGPDFETAWRAIADEVRTMPGNVRQELVRDVSDPDSFVVTSDWSSREAFHAFETSPEQDDLTGPLRELRLEARMSVSDVLFQIDGERP